MRTLLTGASPLAPLLVSALLIGCTQASAEHPWLADLDAGDGVRQSGARLMALAEGLHALESTSSASELLISVHGFASEGYEWVYPLQTLDSASISVWFFRWDYRGCPQPAAEQLLRAVAAARSPETTKVHLVGHSYGGVLLTSVLSNWNLDLPAEVHLVAAPIRGMPGANRCAYAPPTSVANNVTVYEWRTRHELDGAFKDLAEDPQVIALPGSTVTRLPADYNGVRLGHNRSLSWVAEQIAASRQP